MAEKKSWYFSKTILMNILMGVSMIVGVFYAPAGEFIKTYFSEMGMGWAFVNVLLRIITNEEIK